MLTGSSLLHHLDDQKSEMAGQNLLRGKSTHQLAENPTSDDSKLVFGSHVLHEATMYYPMRSLRSDRCLRERVPKASNTNSNIENIERRGSNTLCCKCWKFSKVKIHFLLIFDLKTVIFPLDDAEGSTFKNEYLVSYILSYICKVICKIREGGV